MRSSEESSFENVEIWFHLQVLVQGDLSPELSKSAQF